MVGLETQHTLIRGQFHVGLVEFVQHAASVFFNEALDLIHEKLFHLKSGVPLLALYGHELLGGAQTLFIFAAEMGFQRVHFLNFVLGLRDDPYACIITIMGPKL